MRPTCRLVVIVPFLDEEKYLERCLRTLTDSFNRIDSGREIEVVLIDNGSTDSSAEIALSWQHEHQVCCPIHVLSERRRGVGWARQAGARLAFSRAAARDTSRPRDFWLLSTDSDCTFPADYLSNWLDQIARADVGLLVGGQTFGTDFWPQFPVASRIQRNTRQYCQVLERAFGVINCDGFNHAIDRTYYAAAGPYIQPYTRVGLAVQNHAGEDWDLGTRVRALGLPLRRVDSTVVASPRRFLVAPEDFFTGAAYEGEFRRLEAEVGEDLPPDRERQVLMAARRRLLLHYACKPLLVDARLRAAYQEQLAPDELSAWEKSWARVSEADVFADRNEFIFRALDGFWEEQSHVIANLVGGGSDDFTDNADSAPDP